MAISIDWHTKVIYVPKADMLLLQSSPIEIRQLNINDFRNDLNTLQASEDGCWADTTHEHFPPVTVAGVDLARVVNIINGYTVTFEDGLYAVNLAGGNSNISDVNNKNQVSVNSANSAGLMDIEFMQIGNFLGGVALDVTSTYAGTTFPVGTRGYPVNNLADAHSIAELRGLNQIFVMSSMTLANETMDDGYVFIGDSPATVTITIADSAGIANCEFRNATVTGVLDGNNIFRQCALQDLTYTNGFVFQCALFGTITLGGGMAWILDCYSGVPGTVGGNVPWIDLGGSGNQLALRGYDGGLGVRNASGPSDVHSLDLDSGFLVIDSTVTDGTFAIHGVCEVVDYSTGGTIYDHTINAEVDDVRKLVDADQTLADGSVDNWTLIDPDDGVTVLRTRDVTDKDGDPIVLPPGAPARRTKS